MQTDTDVDNDSLVQAAILSTIKNPGMHRTPMDYAVRMAIFIACDAVFLFVLFLLIDWLHKGGVI